jgi:predicted DNA-binding transcriptional regulator AlpA
MNTPLANEQYIWGVPAISKALGRTARATYHMLERGTLPGAKKIGGRWCFSLAVFARAMESEE